jgi:hypothetical protein
MGLDVVMQQDDTLSEHARIFYEGFGEFHYNIDYRW